MIRQFLQTAYILVYVVLVTIVLATAVIIVALFSRNGNAPHLIARAWARSILFVSGIHVDVTGLENLNVGGSCILMPNHQSNFDIPVLLGCLPVQFRWLAKAELFKIPIFGRGMRGCGYISIDRSNRKSAFQSLAEAATKIRNGVSVLIFPEGTRSRDGKILPFKKGGFVLSVDAGVPIVPIVIFNTGSIMPKGRLRIRTRPVRMDILAPIATAGYTRKTKDDLMELVRRTICNVYEENVQE
ncbi:MAG: 1-acyl-sn-glycerol-3-phosphate acyltransferase [Deltaproteobacteria bacterium]|jgi:1-acyl-sn-glycerol-3-phosphate acyltransferase|nr:1-acyl-sn-glycerol-3-phosphate acyltransferase [Deltaproteobacteria bacterium]